jgi:Glycosyltransferase family 9 (heptosyltransferase)
LEIRLTENDRKFASELLTHHDRSRLLVAIGIGGRAASRKWPLHCYAECMRRLGQQHNVQPVLVCSGEEDAEASELSMMLPVPPYILSGVPLRAVCAVLERCELFVGNDSGATHLAAAMECPTVVVSKHPVDGDPNRANSPVRFAPHCARYRVVQPLLGEDECVLSCRASEPHCILGVTSDWAVAAALELLPKAEHTSPRTLAANHMGGFMPVALAEGARAPGLVAVS